MFQEADIIPYHLSPPPGERVIVLAPHPDDETLGCGGVIRLLLEAKQDVKVIFLTSGEKADPGDPRSQVSQGSREGKLSPPAGEDRGEGGFADDAHVTAYSLLREKEAQKALRTLGVSDYEFLRFPDRELFTHYGEVRGRLLRILEAFRPDTIYGPSMVELNPDHRAAAALSIEFQRSSVRSSAGSGGPVPIRLVFYEVTTPLRPNMLVDITSVYGRKKRALKRYRSQLRLADYLGHITALNTIRALTVNGPRYVEAFWSVEKPLSSEEIAEWLSYRATLAAGY